MSVIEYKFEQYKTLGPIIYKKEKYKLQVELLKLQEDVIKNKRQILRNCVEPEIGLHFLKHVEEK